MKAEKFDPYVLAIENSLKSIEGKEIIETTKMDLDEWLELIFDPKKRSKYLFVDYMFPSDQIREDYFKNISNYSEKEVINLIRKFLIPSGSLNGDYFSAIYLLDCYANDKDKFKRLMEHEYYKRLLKCVLTRKDNVWEGNTWVIDLVKENPKLAIDVLNAYFLAHLQFLPDGRLIGLPDAIALIRAKFIEFENPESLFFDLNPYQFEYLISALYTEMGYKTVVTKKSGDGGVDVIAEMDLTGKKETIFIQCKRTQKKVGEPVVRDLNGTISDARVNKGILITPSDFTKNAVEFASRNSIELINGQELVIMLNTYFGSRWPSKLDYIITTQMGDETFKKNPSTS